MTSTHGDAVSTVGKLDPRTKDVKIRRDGIVLSIEATDPVVRSILENELTYNKITFLRGWAARMAGRNVIATPTECFKHIVDEDGLFPRTMLTAAGYLKQICKALAERGYRPLLKNVWKPDPKTFETFWNKVEGIEWRWKQQETLRLMVANEMGRIDCPTGWGKSFMIEKLARIWPRARIDITTHGVSVIRQLYLDLKATLGSVGMVGDGLKEYGHRVMCYSGKSLHHSDGKADVLIVDECHEFGTPDYMERIAKYKHARRYGFSANHGDRADGADFELLGAFGPVLISVPYQEAEAHDAVVPIEVLWHDVVMDVDPCGGIDNETARERWGIWRNQHRNEEIAAAARQFSEDDQVLIVVKTVEHAVHLKQLLPEFTLCYREGALPPSEREQYISWGLIDNDEPEMTFHRRCKLKEDFSSGKLKKVIATGVWNRGVDFRKLAVLIHADAQNSAIADTQIPGRVSRICKETGKEVGYVVDFLDQFSSTYKRRAESRQKRYREDGWTQIMPARRGWSGKAASWR